MQSRVPEILKKLIRKTAQKYNTTEGNLIRYVMAQFCVMSRSDQEAVLHYATRREKQKRYPEKSYQMQVEEDRESEWKSKGEGHGYKPRKKGGENTPEGELR